MLFQKLINQNKFTNSLFGDSVIKYFIIIAMICCGASISYAQPATVGLLKHYLGSTDDGYVLFAPMNDTTTYLIDKCGYVVHKWGGKHRPGLSVYLLPNGKLLKAGVDKTSPFSTSGGGFIEILDWDGNVQWSYNLSSTSESQHHDIKYMPNGNILAIVYDNKTFDEVQVAGRDPQSFNKYFWSEKIKELRPIGKDSAEIVWEWSAWDHLVQDFDIERANYDKVELHPELIDVNFNSADKQREWHHMNSVDYNAKYDQILLSSRHLDEIWVIDHSTTTAEAASHEGGRYGKGGDLLYRWGNPKSYRQGTDENQQLFHQHDAHWIPDGFPYAGSIMIFNNQQGPAAARFSTVDIIEPPVDSTGFYSNELPYAPAAPEWQYKAPSPTDFFSINLSGAQMLQNGNVLICNGANGDFFEIDNEKNMIWEYLSPVAMGGIVKQGNNPQLSNNVFRCTFYPFTYSAFEGKDLSRKGIIENENANSEGCTLYVSVNENQSKQNAELYPNPTDAYLKIKTDSEQFTLEIYDSRGDIRIVRENEVLINTTELENGIYFAKLTSKNPLKTVYNKFIIWKQ